MNGASFKFQGNRVHFNSKDIDLCIAKLNRLNITYPYNALGVLLTCINIRTDRFPDLRYAEKSATFRCYSECTQINVESLQIRKMY